MGDGVEVRCRETGDLEYRGGSCGQAGSFATLGRLEIDTRVGLGAGVALYAESTRHAHQLDTGGLACATGREERSDSSFDAFDGMNDRLVVCSQLRADRCGELVRVWCDAVIFN